VDAYLVLIDGSSAPADQQSVEDALKDGKLAWLDVAGVDAELLGWLRDIFTVHPLAVQDVSEFGQRPKLEDYGDTSYLVSYAARSATEDLIEVHCFYSERFLITIRREQCGALDALRKRLGQPGGQLPSGRPVRLVLLHHVLDSMVDSFFPVLSDFDDRIDQLQEQIFAKPSEDQLAQLFAMQRWLIGVRKLVTPERDILGTLVSGMTEIPGMDAEGMPYLRDLYDHLIRISDLVDSYRDLLSNAMDAYLSMVSNRLNEVMKQLTIIATVFLPLSFLTGFFGQNFAWLVSQLGGLPTFIVVGVGTELVAVVALYWLFRRRGWIAEAAQRRSRRRAGASSSG
jgi:magnesium transporter